MNKKVLFSVGTTAYNEEKNIEKFIHAVQSQTLPKSIIIKKIIIVASGCTDKTVPIVKKLQQKDKKIKLIIQNERKGKASAVNLFLKTAKTRILILQSADTIPAKTCYKYLLTELIKPNIGLVAAKIVPKDNPNTFSGYANNLKWKLHHKINIRYPQRPKVGELLAFKKIFERIPLETAVDEASIEPLIHLQGFKIIYQPKAILYNQGPKTIREYLSGRRRIYAGHYVTKKKYAYEIITLSNLRILSVFTKNIEVTPKFICFSVMIALFELIARSAGYLDIKLKLRDHAIWKISKTSKRINI